jgi:hypothetical protein
MQWLPSWFRSRNNDADAYQIIRYNIGPPIITSPTDDISIEISELNSVPPLKNLYTVGIGVFETDDGEFDVDAMDEFFHYNEYNPGPVAFVDLGGPHRSDRKYIWRTHTMMIKPKNYVYSVNYPSNHIVVYSYVNTDETEIANMNMLHDLPMDLESKFPYFVYSKWFDNNGKQYMSNLRGFTYRAAHHQNYWEQNEQYLGGYYPEPLPHGAKVPE